MERLNLPYYQNIYQFATSPILVHMNVYRGRYILLVYALFLSETTFTSGKGQYCCTYSWLNLNLGPSADVVNMDLYHGSYIMFLNWCIWYCSNLFWDYVRLPTVLFWYIWLAVWHLDFQTVVGVRGLEIFVQKIIFNRQLMASNKKGQVLRLWW